MTSTSTAAHFSSTAATIASTWSSLRHVRLKDHASAAISLNLLKNFLRRFLVLVVVDDDGGAGLGKAHCRGRTDTSARPGDESDFPLERRAFSLLRHGLKSSNGDGVFRRALFVLRGVVLEGEKLHLHVR